jgi:hypothetical protein
VMCDAEWINRYCTYVEQVQVLQEDSTGG